MAAKTFTQLAPVRQDLHQSLAEAAWWCSERFDPTRPATSLRSPELAPRPLEDSYARGVECVVQARSWPAREVLGSGAPPAGRLMVYFPDADLCDGAAMAATGDYLDLYNCPPHDTWVALFRDEPAGDHATYLVAWVPVAMVSLVSVGIDVNPEECIAWLTDVDVGARRALHLLEEETLSQ